MAGNLFCDWKPRIILVGELRIGCVSSDLLTSLKAVANDTKILPNALRNECAFARPSHPHHRHNDIGWTRSKLRGLRRHLDVRHNE